MRVSWLLKCVLVLVLVLITTFVESLTGNVCSRIESYNYTWRESYEKKVQVITTSWCFSIPPRCSRYRDEWRLAWRIKSEVRQKPVSECCPGYTKQTIKDEVSGENTETCVAHSTCRPGYIGQNCTIECPPGTWGILCKNTCICDPKEICNPTNGSCYCPQGWKGPSCADKCSEGKWGIGCETTCSCTNGSRCHHETGACFEPKLIDDSYENSTENSNEAASSSSPSSTSSYASTSTATITTITNIIDSSEITSTISILSNDDETNANFLEPTTTTERLLDEAYNTVPYDEIILSTLEKVIINDVINGHYENTSAPNTTTDPLSNVAEKVHVSQPSEKVTFIVIGSIISVGLTIMAILAILYVRGKLYETIRLGLYNPEKPDTHPTTLPKEKVNEGKIHPISCSSELLTPPRDYETPKSVSQRPSICTLPRPNSVVIKESTYCNQYPNIHLFNSPQELLEAQYDKPPPVNTFSQLKIEFFEGEHLYDEIPLQPTTPDNNAKNKDNKL